MSQSANAQGGGAAISTRHCLVGGPSQQQQESSGPPGLLSQDESWADAVRTLAAQVHSLTQIMHFPKGGGQGLSSQGWTEAFSGATPSYGGPPRNWQAPTAPVEHPMHDWGASSHVLHLEGGEDSFGRMTRGSTGMAVIIYNREVNPWGSVENLELLCRRQAGATSQVKLVRWWIWSGSGA